MQTRIWTCAALLALGSHAAVAQDSAAAEPAKPVRVIPPLSERPLDITEGDRIATAGFRVRGAGNHPEIGVKAADVQRLADGLFELISGEEPLTIAAAMERAGERRAPPVVGLTVGQMQQVAEQIAIYLRNSGLVLAQAYVPVQDIGVDGLVAIDVVEAKLGKVVVEGAKRMPPSLIAASANSLKDNALTRDRIESALLTAQTLPGTSVIGTFRPGENTGETDLVLRVQNEETFEFRVGADNYGTDLAGEYRLRADALINNPTGFGDQLALSVVQAFSPADTTFGSVSYAIRPGIPQVSVHVRAERAAFVAENSLATLDVDGDNETYEAGVRWDVARTRVFNMSSGLAFQARRADVKFDDTPLTLTDDDLRVGALDVVIQRFDSRFKGVDFLDATYHRGTDRANGFELIGNDDRFSLFRLGYSRYQRITDDQTLLLLTRAQFSNDTLSALERLSLGGPDSVRAYPVSEILSDRGVLASLEYRVAAPGFSAKPSPFKGVPWGKVLQVMVFADYAKGELADNDPGQEISGAGAGLLMTAPGNLNIKLTGATPLGSVDPSDGDDFRLYSEISLAF